MICFIYLRVSTDDKGQDPKLQLQPCLDFIAQRQYGEYKVFQEEGSAWQRHSRPIFEGMLEQAFKEKIEHIVVWRYDRVSRRRIDFLSIWTKCNLQGIKIHSVTETFIETLNNLPKPWDEIMGRFMLEIVAWLSEEESRKKSENVKRAYQAGKHQGVWGRPSKSDYYVKRILELRKEGKSIGGISKELGMAENTVRKYIRGSKKDKEKKAHEST
jgi:site-specific DNA recombinase